MDPGTIINVVGLVVQLLQVVCDACKDGRKGHKRRKRCHDELHRFDEELHDYLLFANNIKERAVPIGFKSKSLDVLHDELQKFVSSAKDLLSSNNCKKEDVQQLREHAKDMLQKRMGHILLEVCFKSCEDIRVVKEMLAKNQAMVSKNNGVHINIFSTQAHGNPMLTTLAPYVTESLWECFCRVLVDKHLNLSCEDIRVIKEMMAKNQAMVSKNNGVHINIFPTQAHGNPMLMTLAPDVTESLWECFCRVLVLQVLVDKHLNLVVPTVEADPFVHPFRIADVGMIKGVEESGRIKEAMYVPQEEEEKMDKKRKEGAGMDVLEEKEKMKEAPLTERASGQWSILERQQHNPNRNMELSKMGGKGDLLMSKLEGRHIEMTYTWCEEDMGIVIGKSPMEVSRKLGYWYLEVKLEEMAELLERSKTGLAGVGVGLAREEKIKNNKMAGKYSKSCGYDGRAGEVYYDSRVQEGPSRLNFLEMGDTLGIGLLQHHGQHKIFFTKNRELQVCFRVDSLCASSSHSGVFRGLYPVISLASAHVRLHVNFQGPFEMSELLVQVKAHK